MLFSFVIPCYRSEKTIENVVNEIISTVKKRDDFYYEIICVNDCSPDNVYSVLLKLANKNKKIKIINFSKNMGKHAAVLAGYSVCKGDYIINLDDDMQSPTYELWKMYDYLIENDYDYVTAEYVEKKESWIKRKGSDLNSWMSKVMIDKPKDLRFENLSIMKSFVAKEMINYKNPYPYLSGLILRVTRKIGKVLVEQRERGDDNKSGFTIGKSFSLLINGLTSFSVKPLRIASIAGFIVSIIGAIYGIIIILNKLINNIAVPGYSSLMAVLLFSSGLIMIMLGMIGEYIGRIYICINDSPQYVIRNTINVDNEK